MTEKFIKISDLKKKLNYIFRVYGISPQTRKTINEAINKIPYTIKGDLETTLEVADMQKIVRCKDCEYRKTEDCAMQYECECGAHYFWDSDNAFCSWGKRKENGIDDE